MQILKRYANNFSQRIEEFRSNVKYKDGVMSRVISIEVLWKSFYFNTLNQKVNFKQHSSFFRPHTLSSSSFFVIYSCLYVLWIKVCLLITYLRLKATCRVLNYSKIVPRHDHRQISSPHITNQNL